MEIALKASNLRCKGENITIPAPLCKHHYYTIYSVLHQPQQTNCPTCGASLKYANTRSCPDAVKVKAQLIANAGFKGNLCPGDKVCYSCYKSHLAILQVVKQVSTDNDLQEVIDMLKNTSHPQPPGTLEHVHSRAMERTAIHVGEQLLKRQAMLLTAVHELFKDCCREIISHNDLNVDIRATSSMWVLSHLSNTLQHHLAYSCKTCKYGTILYRPGTDLMPLLQHALWKIRQLEQKPNEETAHQLTEGALTHFNTLLLNQIKTFLAQDQEFWDNYLTTDFAYIIEKIEPELWNAITKITAPASKPADDKIKKVRCCLYCVL